MRILADIVGVVGTWLFIVVYGTALYWLLIFKGQSSSDVLPPSNSAASPWVTAVIVATLFKAYDVAAALRRQTQCNVFLIDWEHGTPVIGRTPLEAEASRGGVAWRMLFVANEFAELQLYRYVP
jgi:hypothetical protein